MVTAHRHRVSSTPYPAVPAVRGTRWREAVFPDKHARHCTSQLKGKATEGCWQDRGALPSHAHTALQTMKLYVEPRSVLLLREFVLAVPWNSTLNTEFECTFIQRLR